MGVVETITATSFPRQGDWVGKRTRVCFHYQDPEVFGTVVRDDRESPLVTIIRLDDGRYVLTTECQHSLPGSEYLPEPKRPQTPEEAELVGVREAHRAFKIAILQALGIENAWAITTWRTAEFVKAITNLRRRVVGGTP